MAWTKELISREDKSRQTLGLGRLNEGESKEESSANDMCALQ